MTLPIDSNTYLTEWLASRLAMAYPLSDDASMVSNDGRLVPTSFLADMSLNVPPSSDENYAYNFFVSSISFTGSYVNMEISYMPSSGDPFVCGLVYNIPSDVNTTTDIADRTFLISAAADLPAAYSYLSSLYGTVVIGTCQDIVQGVMFTMTLDAGRILNTCIHSGLACVSSIKANGISLTGDIIIQAGDGIEFETSVNEAGNTVLLIKKADTGTEQGYDSVDAVVEAVKAKFGSPVMTLNGIIPDSEGNITLNGLDCSSVEAAGAGTLVLSNPCSTPCCGSTSTTELSQGLATLELSLDMLTSHYESLANNINAIASRLSSVIAAKGN